MLAPDGAACMTVHTNIDYLCIFIRHLASSLKLKEPIPFELASVDVQHYDSECASEFAGFGREDFVSDGEFT